jgi:hypothetical protein
MLTAAAPITSTLHARAQQSNNPSAEAFHMTRQLLSITLALVLSLAATWAHAQAEDPVIDR